MFCLYSNEVVTSLSIQYLISAVIYISAVIFYSVSTILCILVYKLPKQLYPFPQQYLRILVSYFSLFSILFPCQSPLVSQLKPFYIYSCLRLMNFCVTHNSGLLVGQTLEAVAVRSTWAETPTSVLANFHFRSIINLTLSQISSWSTDNIHGMVAKIQKSCSRGRSATRKNSY